MNSNDEDRKISFMNIDQFELREIARRSPGTPKMNPYEAFNLNEMEDYKQPNSPGFRVKSRLKESVKESVMESQKESVSDSSGEKVKQMTLQEKEPNLQNKNELSKSRLSPTLLSNYLLAITLLKNLALKYTSPESFDENFRGSLIQLAVLEKSILSDPFKIINLVQDSIGESLNPSLQEETMAAECYLVKQHKEEILDKNHSF